MTRSPESKPTLTADIEGLVREARALASGWGKLHPITARTLTDMAAALLALSARAPLPPDIEGLANRLQAQALIVGQDANWLAEHDLFMEAAAAILSLQAQAKAARRTALEEAARNVEMFGTDSPGAGFWVCDSKDVCNEIAKGIRALISEEEGTTHG